MVHWSIGSVAVTTFCLVSILDIGYAAIPGFPFAEDFADTNLRDATRTNANWSTDDQALLLSFRRAQFGAFDPQITSGTDITSDADSTLSVAVGDVNGDGLPDIVTGNSGQRNRLYLNNGTPSPFSGVTGSDITTDMPNVRGIALGDLDRDGDLDLVTVSNLSTNRLYLNNGTSDPFAGAVGSDITADVIDANAVALGDLDSDGDLDMAVAKSGGNSLYLNNGTDDPFAGVVSAGLSTDASLTTSIALGDMDSDGDLDVVVGNFTQPNRLYLNNGTASPFEGVAGSDITSDTHSTRAVALGDINGDGALDLIVGNDGQANRFYLNNGTSAPFEGVVGADISPTGFQTFAISVGDVDGDGDLDVVAVVSNNRNRVYINNGTPSPFEGAVASSITADIVPLRRAGVLADMDLDGDLDLVTGNLSVPDRLYLNNGNANPWNGAVESDIISDGSRTQQVAIGDMDGDGDLDLVVGNGGFGSAPNRLYLNNGTSNPFIGVAGSNITADNQSTRAIAVGDVDGDGDLDVVAGNTGVNSRNRLYLNNGTSDPFGGVTGSDITTDEHTTRAVALGDMDGDGDLDFIAGNANTPPRFYRNNGGPNPFSGAVGTDITTDIAGADDIALGDIDGDGDLDLVYGRFLDTTRLVLNNGTSDPFAGVLGFDVTAETPLTVDVELGDVDGDGDLDILLAVENQPPRLYLNNGTSDPFQGVSGGNISTDTRDADSAALGDVDGDGDLDVALGNSLETNRLYLNNGTVDPFEGVLGLDITADVNDNSSSVALADMDGDGALDFVVGIFNDPSRLYLNNATPKPVLGWREGDFDLDTFETQSLAFGDVDRDGDTDLVFGTFSQGNRLYLNNGTADPFQDVEGTLISTDANPTVSVALGDVDGDGDLDLVAGNGSASIVANLKNRLYLNNGTSDPFAAVIGQDITSDNQYTSSVALGDVDGDGDLDMVAGNQDLPPATGVNRLYLNNGTSDPFAGVAGSDISSDTDETSSVALGDMDNDGDLDIVAVNFNSRNRLYLNNGSSNPFAGVVGSDITTDEGANRTGALGDLDGDGDLDLVVGRGIRERLYFNNGTSNPFNGITGINLSNENDDTSSVALGDVDADGDLDVLEGNFLFRGPTFLHLNNGTADPFAGTASITITPATPSTQAIALADFDGDGTLDVVMGNSGAPSQIFTRRLFHTAQGRGVSLAVDDEALDISEAVLDVTETLPVNTGVDYWLSNNGGLQSFLVTPGELFTFPTTGSDLRWRAELKSLSPFLSPRLDTLNLRLGRDLIVDPTSINFMEQPIDAGPTESVTVTITNQGAADVSVFGFGIEGADFNEFTVTQGTTGIYAPGFSGTFAVAFDPASLGPKSASFFVNSTDPAKPFFPIPLTGIGIEQPTATPTETETETPTPSETTIVSPTETATASPTPTVDLSATPSETPTDGPSPTPSDTETPGPSPTPTFTEGPSPTPSETPTPGGPADFDIHPDIPNGVINAGDLLRWFERLQGTGNDRTLLFDFARFWMNGT